MVRLRRRLPGFGTSHNATASRCSFRISAHVAERPEAKDSGTTRATPLDAHRPGTVPAALLLSVSRLCAETSRRSKPQL